MKKNTKLIALMALLCSFTMAFTVAGCKKTDNSSESSSVESDDPGSGEGEVIFALSDTEIEIHTTENKTVIATVAGTTEAVVWSSSNESVATVDENGRITALKEGTAVISATVAGQTKTVNVTVTDVVLLVPTEDVIFLNADIWTDSNGTEYGVKTKQIGAVLNVNGVDEETEITYTSLSKSIATVDANGVVTALKFGQAIIQATATYNGKTYTAEITVKVGKLFIESSESFTFGGDKSAWEIDVSRFGFHAEDVVSIYLESGDDFVQTDEYGDIVFDGDKAKVITEGIDIESKTEPDVVVIETAYLQVQIKIAYVTADNVEFISEVSPMLIGGQKQFKLYANGIEVSEQATWSVNKEQIATIDENGVVTAVNYGTVVITASVYGYTYKTTQVVYKGEEMPADNYSTDWKVPTAFNENNEAVAWKHGYKIETHGKYAANDWVSFRFTANRDIEGGTLYIYYGYNNYDGANTYNGYYFVCAGAQSYTAGGFNDSSFLIIDEDGNQIGSFNSEDEGFGVFEEGKSYTVYVKIPDDGSVNHDLYFFFASNEVHIGSQQVESGVVYWRDGLNELGGITTSAYEGYFYNGETRNNVNIEGTYSFNAATLETENKLDVAAMGITDEILSAKIVGSKIELFATENGKPVVTDGKLTLNNDFFTYNGTSGVKQLLIETDDNNYYVNFEIVPTNEKFNNTVDIIPGATDYIIMDGRGIVSSINSGKQYVAFDMYLYNNISADNYLYFQVGARHFFILNNQTYIHSTWDTSRLNKLTENFVKIYNAEGTLVNDTITWGGNKLYGTKSNELQKGQWYRVVVDLDGRAWGDDICSGEYNSVASFMVKSAGNLKAYLGDFHAFGEEEIAGIALDKTSVSMNEGTTITLTATVASTTVDKTVVWTSSNNEIATVVDGVVTALKGGTITITARNGDKEATCQISVLGKLHVEDGMTELSNPMSSWLPGTFDVGAAGSETNICPTFVATEELFGDHSVVDITFTMKTSGGYINLYEIGSTDTGLWSTDLFANIKKGTIIGGDYFGGAFLASNTLNYAGIDTLAIYEIVNGELVEVTGKVAWQEGHTYTIRYAIKTGSSLQIWYTHATAYNDGTTSGVFHGWNIPEYCASVYDNIEINSVKAGYTIGSSTISVSVETKNVTVGETLNVNAVVKGTSNKTITWTSSNNEIATVENGVVTGVKAGVVTITATLADGTSAYVELKVNAVAIENVTITFKHNDKVVESKTISYNTATTAPEAPANYLGYIFAGWFDEDNNPFSTESLYKDDAVFVAKYVLDETSTQHEYTFGKLTQLLSATEMMAKIESNENYLVFEFTPDSTFGESVGVYMQISGRHVAITRNGLDLVSVRSGWDDPSAATVPADIFAVYDAQGVLVNNYVYSSHGAQFWTATGEKVKEFEVGKTYTVVINLNGRGFVGNDIATLEWLNQYEQHVFVTTANGAYIQLGESVQTLSQEDVSAMLLEKSGASDYVDVTFVSGTDTIESKHIEKDGTTTAPAIPESAPQYFGYTAVWTDANGVAFDETTEHSENTTYTLQYVKGAVADKNGYSAFADQNYMADGNAIVAAHAEGKDYAVFNIYINEDLTSTDAVYFQVGARHFVWIPGGTYLKSTEWDKSNIAGVTENFFRVYASNGELINRFTVIAGGTFGDKNDVPFKGGNTYTIVIDMNGRAWDDATMASPYEGATIGDLGAAGLLATVCGNLHAQINFLGAKTANEVNALVLEMSGASEDSISLDKTAATVLPQQTVTLQALNMDMEGVEAEWTSSNNEIATVENGVVTGLKTGVVTITATKNGKTASCTVTVMGIVESTEKTMTLTSWLPGTFDKGAAGSNQNIAPAVVLGEGFEGCNILKITFTMKTNGGYIQLYDYASTDNNTLWADALNAAVTKSAVIGNDYYGAGYFNNTANAKMSANDLFIRDDTTGEVYSAQGVAWTQGHTYTVYCKVAAGHSLVIWYSSVPYTEDVSNAKLGPINRWNFPEEYYNVLESLEGLAVVAGQYPEKQ